MALLSHLSATAHWLAQAAEPPPAGGGSMTSMLLIYGLMIFGFYFLFIAPQRKRMKEQQKMLAELKPGDNVLTSFGVFGTISQFRGDRVVVKIADNTRIEMLKSAIQAKITGDAKPDAKD